MENNFKPEYCYIKKYELTKHGSVCLKNPEPAQAYINDRVNLLFNAKNKTSELQVKLRILKEFIEIYEYDCSTSIRPKPFGTFENDKEMKDFIKLKQLVEDFGLYLGNIFCNYHENIVNQKRPIPILECDTLVIDYNELYRRAINEYFGTLLGYKYPVQIGTINCGDNNNGGKLRYACGTTYILPVLIEHFLLMYLQNRILFKGIKDIKHLVTTKSIHLEDEEKNIIDEFTEAKAFGSALMNGTKEQTMRKMFEIFIKYGVMQRNQDNEQILVGKFREKITTLGSIFHSKFARKEIRTEYYELISILFDTRKLNIRNCIMHGNSVTYNYLEIVIASVMLQLLWDIASGDVFVN